MKNKSSTLNRRNFLRFTAGMSIALGLDSLIPAYAKQVVTANEPRNKGKYSDLIDLQIQQTKLPIASKNASTLTVNGSIPGPLVRLREGQTATIQVTNNLDEDTSLHWHGLIVPREMDGVPGISYAGIKPGETFTYRFPVKQSGTYWYHSHSGLQEQLGHYGPIIIDPIEPEPFEYDRDYVVLLSDWTFEDPYEVLANLKKFSPYYNYQRPTIGQLAKNLAWNRMRMDPTDIADVTGATYTYLMNGMASDANWTGLFKPGEKVRLRFINGSAMTFFDIRIPGLKMTVVQADGQNIMPVDVDEFRIATAETYDVIVELQENTAYTVFAETMDRSGYARGTLAPRQGMSAAIPKQRTRPIRTMADMGMAGDMSGMDMSGNNSSHDMSGMNMGSNNSSHNMSGMDMGGNNSSHNMSGMDMGGNNSSHNMSGMDTSGSNSSSHNMPGMDMGGNSSNSMSNNRGVMHSADTHGAGNSGVAMMSKSRLDEPGIGLQNTKNHRVLLYNDLISLKPNQKQRKPEREMELHLTGNMERYMWSFDGKKFSQIEEPMVFFDGERLRLTFVNDTMMEHPIHLHGMWMELVNGSGLNQPRKHTLNVKPAERVSVDVNVDAPGYWAFHCHLLYHMKVGMFRTVAVVDRSTSTT
ncbi:copper resistance system multicopper oxidase [Myxosarcina sp. GI1]|uniref:copper resistance system multicopper oxidase n=1 Tax=Myxosarcina sp. GI1 TaxID=1541065 RepID=UPI00056D0ED2|nr:copper resistance system multicopper oxidase [Myxosarcina sp. GI1]